MIASVYIIAAILGGAFAQLFMKAGLTAVTTTSFQSVIYSVNEQPLKAAYVLLGIVLYATSMVLWVYALKRYKLNKAYPLLSLGYVVVYFAASIWPGLYEDLSTQKSFGISLIILGVWITQRDRDEAKLDG